MLRTVANNTNIVSASSGPTTTLITAEASGSNLPPGDEFDLRMAQTTSGVCWHGSIISAFPRAVDSSGNLARLAGTVPFDLPLGDYEVCFRSVDSSYVTQPDFFTVTKPKVYPAGKVYDSGDSAIEDGGKTQWSGAYTRYGVDDADPDFRYSADQSKALGHGTFGHVLTSGGTEHRYGFNTTVVEWAPNGSSPAEGSCKQESVSLSLYGITLSQSYQLCPEVVVPDKQKSSFATEWTGKSTKKSQTVGTVAQSFAKTAEDQGEEFTYVVSRSRCPRAAYPLLC